MQIGQEITYRGGFNSLVVARVDEVLPNRTLRVTALRYANGEELSPGLRARKVGISMGSVLSEDAIAMANRIRNTFRDEPSALLYGLIDTIAADGRRNTVAFWDQVREALGLEVRAGGGRPVQAEL